MPIPDPWEEAESPNHRPGPTDPASPHCPHLTSLSALCPPLAAPGCPLPADSAAPASGLPLCVPGSTPAHLPRPPGDPQATVTAPPCCCRAPPRSKATLACGVLRVEKPAVGSQRPYQAGTVPSPGDRQAMGLGEVKSSPMLPPPPPRASLSAYRAAPSHRAAGTPGSLPSHHPLSWGPRTLGTPSYSLGYLGAWPPASPACVWGTLRGECGGVDGWPGLCSHFNTSL